LAVPSERKRGIADRKDIGVSRNRKIRADPDAAQGGVTQGIGWALNEEYIYDEQGLLENPGFLDYRCPVASDMPMIDPVIVEVPNPRHPFGVRGVGEVPIVPPMAAVANAIHAAIGTRLRDLPMSPPKILAEIDAEEPKRLAAE
jgi:CO/xanthine dehydrogenase Mo-binding subunit